MKIKPMTLLAVVAFAGWQPLAKAQAIVDLGDAAGFAVLAGSAITFTSSPVTITGDIGSYPTATINNFGNATFVSGTDRSGDTVFMAGAKSDLAAAYASITTQSATSGVTSFTNGATLMSGVYSIASIATDLTGTITLNGDANDVFIFKMSSTLITASGSQILFTGGARPENTFWQVATSATLAGGSVFGGNILALAAITVGSGTTVDGRLLAQDAAVTFAGGNTITLPAAIPEPATTSVLIAGFLGLIIGARKIRRKYSDRSAG